jgi:large subunit ribosomal protein L6
MWGESLFVRFGSKGEGTVSRIGKLPIPLPSGVTAKLEDGALKVSGPKGNLQHTLPEGVSLDISKDHISITRADDHRRNRALHGLTRSIVSNLVTGVTKGFERVLEINGVGYRSEVQGNTLVLSLGYSHPIHFILPEKVTATVDKQNRIIIEGCDKQRVGETAAKIRAFRPPEPYKGKGIKFAGERVRRKVGKTAAK